MILIIGNTTTYESRKIISEIKKRKNKYKFISWDEINLPFNGQDISAVLIRSPPSLNWKDMSTLLLTIIEEIERKEIPVYPSSYSLKFCDKYSTYSLMSKQNMGIVMPKTILTSNLKKANLFLDENKEVISKPLIGGGGKGIIKIDVKNKDIIKKIINERGYIFLQKFIKNFNFDIRTIIIDQKVISQYARYNENDFRYNLKLGGKSFTREEMTKNRPEFITYFKDAEEKSIKISNKFNLEMYATDFLPSQEGKLYFLEINPFFGFKGSKEKIAIEILNYLDKTLKQ